MRYWFQARTAQRDLGRDLNLGPLRFPPARLEAPSAAPQASPPTLILSSAVKDLLIRSLLP